MQLSILYVLCFYCFALVWMNQLNHFLTKNIILLNDNTTRNKRGYGVGLIANAYIMNRSICLPNGFHTIFEASKLCSTAEFRHFVCHLFRFVPPQICFHHWMQHHKCKLHSHILLILLSISWLYCACPLNQYLPHERTMSSIWK